MNNNNMQRLLCNQLKSRNRKKAPFMTVEDRDGKGPRNKAV